MSCPSKDTPPESQLVLPTRKGEVSVRVIGRGPKVMIALHGFGFDAEVFARWEAYLGEAFTIYAPDLPFHGQTTWTGRHFTPTDTAEVLAGIQRHSGAARYTLLGHSLGARIIICTARYWVADVDEVVLLAPAGIGSYDRVPPVPVQRVVEAALGWPHWLGALARWGNALGLVSNFQRKYAEVVLLPRDKRRQLFRVLNSLPHFRTSDAAVVAFWQRTPIKGHIVLGSNDKFVPNHRIRAYFEPCEHVRLEEITDSHDLVNPRVGQLLRHHLA